jgi:acylphosphatase/predicted  nucleic acid-binding Zn-ribbon protein
MAVRAEIYISGRVQKAGYRDFIDEVAYCLRINGYVKNLKDGRVELICEGEKEAIKSLIDRINIEEYPIRVEDVSVTYGDATGEFKSFDIIREEDITMATYERMDLAARYMRQMNNNLGEKIDSVGSKIDILSEKTDKGFSELGDKIDILSEKTDRGFSELGGKIDTGFSELGEKIDGVGNKIDVLSEKTDNGFSELGEKIDNSSVESSVRLDTVSRNTGELNDKIDHLSQELPVVVEKVDRFREDTIGAFGELDRKYHVISQNLERLNGNIERMVDDLGILIREFVEEKRRNEE